MKFHLVCFELDQFIARIDKKRYDGVAHSWQDLEIDVLFLLHVFAQIYKYATSFERFLKISDFLHVSELMSKGKKMKLHTSPVRISSHKSCTCGKTG